LQVLLDVGAGNGYFSLAAAARGHDVIAFELSNASLASFESSAKYNGFLKAISLHKVIPCPGFWSNMTCPWAGAIDTWLSDLSMYVTCCDSTAVGRFRVLLTGRWYGA
jgi:hypothetical protein